MPISLSGSLELTGSIITTGTITMSGSIASASFATTSSNALTASSADTFIVRNNFTGSNALLTGTLTAQTLIVQTVTSSILYTSGSNRFGSQLTDQQTFTGSLFVTGAANFKTNQNFVLNSSSTGWIASFVNDYNNTSYIGVDNDGIYMQPSSRGSKMVAGNGTTYLYVTSSGIGIGNTNPKATLHLGASLNTMASATSIAVAGDTSIRFTGGSDGNADYGSYIAGTQYAGVRALSLGYRQGAGDILTMTITQLSENTGSVGIGTTSPSSTFHVKGKFGAPLTTGTSLNGVARFGQTSGNGGLDIGFGDPYSWLQSRNATDYSVNYNLSLQPNGGNVGIGTTTPAQTLEVNGNILASSTGKIGFRYSSTDGNYYSYLRSATAGNVGPIVLAGGFESGGGGNEAIRLVTNANPGERTVLSINNAGTSTFYGDTSLQGNNYINTAKMIQWEGGSYWAFRVISSAATFQLYQGSTGNTPITVDSAGRVSLSTPSTYALTVTNTTNTSGQGVFVTALGSNNNNASSYHYIAATGGADKFYLFGNGTYQTVSDIRLKKNITTVTDTYLDKLKDLRVVNYNWKDQEDGHPLEFGLIAQEVEEIIPSIVHEGREHEDNIKYKGVQASVLPYILIKAIQELKAEFDSYKETHP